METFKRKMTFVSLVIAAETRLSEKLVMEYFWSLQNYEKGY